MRHFLTSYSIDLKAKNLESGTAPSLSEIIKSYLCREEKTAQLLDKFLRFGSHETPDEFSFCGLIKAGEFGFTAELTNIKTGSLKAEQTVDDANLLPFFFYIKVMSETTAILILQKAGNHGIKGALEEGLKNFCETKYSDYTLQFSILQQQALVDTFFNNGSAKFVTITMAQCPEEIADDLDEDDRKKLAQDFHAELRIRLTPVVRKWYDKLKINIVKNKNTNGLVKLYGNTVKAIKANVEYNGRTKVFCLNNLADASIDMELNSDMIDINGHPKYDEIKKEAAELITILHEARKGKVRHVQQI